MITFCGNKDLNQASIYRLHFIGVKLVPSYREMRIITNHATLMALNICCIVSKGFVVVVSNLCNSMLIYRMVF
jgi:hypothetical protein